MTSSSSSGGGWGRCWLTTEESSSTGAAGGDDGAFFGWRGDGDLSSGIGEGDFGFVAACFTSIFGSSNLSVKPKVGSSNSSNWRGFV